MATSRDYYEILGVPRSASADDIRKAHRKLVRKLHPDVNKAPQAAKQFSEVQEAYDVLSDPKKREAYDRFGHAGVHAEPPPGAGAAGAGAGAGYRVHIDPEDFSSVFEELFGGARGRSRRGGRSSPFEGFQWEGGGSPFGGAGAAPTTGGDAEASITVPFMTAALGGNAEVRMRRPDGKTETISVHIPAGFQDGGKLRLKGKGHPGPAGAGDLYLAVTVEPHPWFRRDGLDILLDVPITIAEAALGTTITVPLLSGSIRMKVPPGTGSGRKLRLKGRGIEGPRGAKGDFYAVITITGPEHLTDEDKAALERMSERLGDPRAKLPWAVE